MGIFSITSQSSLETHEKPVSRRSDDFMIHLSIYYNPL